MTRLAAGIAVALALAGVAAGTGGQDGLYSATGAVHGDSEKHLVVAVPTLHFQGDSHARGASGTEAGRDSGGDGQRAHGYSLRIHGLASDGIATPAENTPTAGQVAELTATPEPTRDAPVFGASVIDIIRSYDWPDDYAIAVADCESGFDPLAWNPFPVYLDGIEHHATGVMQVLIPLHLWRFEGASPYDPAANVRVAYQLWLERGFQPWNSGGCP